MENKYRVLIADDEQDITDLINTYLTSHGYICDVVDNGKEALSKLKQNKYDIVLLDVMMPYIDGYHVAYEITNSSNTLPIIIILTSRDIQFERNIAKMSGAYEIIQKPFELDMLYSTIQKALKEKEAKNENTK